MDEIVINGLNLFSTCILHPQECAHYEKGQLLSITVTFGGLDLSLAGKNDSLINSINYSSMAQMISQFLTESNNSFPKISLIQMSKDLINFIASQLMLDTAFPNLFLKIEYHLPKLSLYTDNITLVTTCFPYSVPSNLENILVISDLIAFASIGLNQWEKSVTQRIKLSFLLSFSSIESHYFPVDSFIQNVLNFIHISKFSTVEGLSHSLTNYILTGYPFTKAQLKLEKLNALSQAISAVINITRHKPSIVQENIVFLALGSNLGNKLENIHKALDLLKQLNGIQLIKTSFLYQTKPMYYLDQDIFLNCACQV